MTSTSSGTQDEGQVARGDSEGSPLNKQTGAADMHVSWISGEGRIAGELARQVSEVLHRHQGIVLAKPSPEFKVLGLTEEFGPNGMVSPHGMMGPKAREVCIHHALNAIVK